MDKEKITAIFSKDVIMAPEGDFAKQIYDKSRFGEQKGKRFYYSFVEALYLLEEEKMELFDGRNKKLNFDSFVKRARRVEPRFWTKYIAYKEMRKRGYIVKTALKFGADFRIYGRGVKPGEDHAKWVMYSVHEREVMTWYDFSAKNRVANSTKKKLLLGVVDDEGDVTFYEVKWTRP
ncbi:tRNA-intron lyase [archaeon]|nr:tRNA-intron lyase [archaeon]